MIQLTNQKEVLRRNLRTGVGAVHVYYTYEGSFLCKKPQKSTTLVYGKMRRDFQCISLNLLGFLGVLNGDLGGARTPDLMLRRSIVSQNFPLKSPYLSSKYTNSARKVNQFNQQLNNNRVILCDAPEWKSKNKLPSMNIIPWEINATTPERRVSLDLSPSPLSDTCDCEDCQDSEHPCAHDCDVDDQCEACREFYEGILEIQHEIDHARGLA